MSFYWWKYLPFSMRSCLKLLYFKCSSWSDFNSVPKAIFNLISRVYNWGQETFPWHVLDQMSICRVPSQQHHLLLSGSSWTMLREGLIRVFLWVWSIGLTCVFFWVWSIGLTRVFLWVCLWGLQYTTHLTAYKGLSLSIKTMMMFLKLEIFSVNKMYFHSSSDFHFNWWKET